MEYNVDPNSPNISTTMETEKHEWSINDVYYSALTPDILLKTLEVIDTFKRKYPNDDIIKKFETIVRNEICMMFGGSLNVE